MFSSLVQWGSDACWQLLRDLLPLRMKTIYQYNIFNVFILQGGAWTGFIIRHKNVINVSSKKAAEVLNP